ncbi:ASPARTYL PROTEASE FAMILY PROTEIN 1 [Salix koriyanagi]|uniref:ASPARTYL PROTEASE FAMILY PROTEIN 1 n=1 Tax=Salix koriyanagi TaxID=2511006 RepID=A0A9Q0P603_9ROSI|nr:ASPARTYL PROTEASE FAMILY PROTEIN 1 [Salix koriyanagi]
MAVDWLLVLVVIAIIQKTPIAFYNGNETYRIDTLGFLHYADVSVGTPNISFLVALDTGSNLFWLPCDCSSCVRQSLGSPSGPSSTSTVRTNRQQAKRSPATASCAHKHSVIDVPSDQSNCPYEAVYLSNGTSTSGYLVQDSLHLVSDDSQSKAIDAKITFGCGQVQTGSFLTGGAPNGLFGLGMANISVPSTLAHNGYTSGSFSMCFRPDGIGRISFGDKGSTGQGETSFNQGQPSSLLYNISIAQTIIGGQAGDLVYSAIFDSGTSFTYLNDPAYTLIAKNFNKLVKEMRHSSTDLPFDYCYDISANQTELTFPTVNLVMSSGDYFNVTNPIILFEFASGDVNIIGQNFMVGYRIVFDRERMILGWKPSNCYDDKMETNTLAVSPNTAVPPATAVNPTATSTQIPAASPPGGSHSPLSKPFTYTSMMTLVLFFAIV